MRYKLLGHSGLRVSEICLGTMTFGEAWGPMGADREAARAIYAAFRDRGGNFIDTANNYQGGASESLVGEFIAGERDRMVVATKYTLSTDPDDPNAGGNHRKNMVQAVEKSLRRLGTDYIDLYHVHIWEFTTPADEVLRGLDDLVRAGKVVYVGVSDTPAWVVSRCDAIAELRGWSRFVALQIENSLLERTPERELLPMARALDIAVTAWSPLASGVLSGKHADGLGETGRPNMAGGRIDARAHAIVAVVAEVARELGRTPAQVALNWLRQGPYPVIPIVGARRVAQIVDNLGCLDFELTAEQVGRLAAASAVPLGFPHEFFNRDSIRALAFGRTFAQIDDHRRGRGV
jgi:aryl-alcohol dehydrogenase-like predicted oxidoreductase